MFFNIVDVNLFCTKTYPVCDVSVSKALRLTLRTVRKVSWENHSKCNQKTPGAPLINFNDGGGGSDRGLYFIPKNITTSEFVYPKK